MKVSESPQTIRRRSSRLKADELLLNIPMDLVTEIFSRLPLKSIATCRCVSKRWTSVLRRPDFTDLFLTKSSARPQLLFAHMKESEVIFSSSPQPQNPDENLSTIAVEHMSFPVGPYCAISSVVNGYVCISYERIFKGSKSIELVVVVFNPSTGQSFTLPRMKAVDRFAAIFLGYDPIEKQHKVLICQDGDEHQQVLTLRGDGNVTWRLIECGILYFSDPGPGDSVCINGVLYYIAVAFDGDMIVCFDVRSEKYSFVKFTERDMRYATLVNFQGKLALVRSRMLYNRSSYTNASLEMWILEDFEKHEWSNHVFKLPPTWKDVVVTNDVLSIKGVTVTNEFVLSPSYPFDHVYYYNFVKETIIRVEFQGIGTCERHTRVFTYLNHVKDVKLM